MLVEMPARILVREQGRRSGGLPIAYFCQVRFLWRLARSCLRLLCLLILAFRRFFSEPILIFLPALQYTTLFSGYSMIPSAPAALSCGMISRTIVSSITVSTATQPDRLK